MENKEKGTLNSEKDLENTEENCEMIWTIWKKIVIRYENNRRKAS